MDREFIEDMKETVVSVLVILAFGIVICLIIFGLIHIAPKGPTQCNCDSLNTEIQILKEENEKLRGEK